MLTENTERKLQYFSKTITQELEVKRQQHSQEATETYAKAAATALESAKRRNKVMLQAQHNELQRQANRKRVQAKVKEIARYVEERQRHIDTLFVDVTALLAGFTQEPGYERYLIERVYEMQALHNNLFTIIKLSPHDMRLEKAIAAATGLIPENSGQDFVGGFILVSSCRRLQKDCTFRTGLANHRASFEPVV